MSEANATSPRQLTILFQPENAYGPTNNCVGIGHQLLQRGHRVVFAVDKEWEGKLKKYGFEEAVFELMPVDESEPVDPDADFWADYIREAAPEFAKSTFEQLETVIAPIASELIVGAKNIEPRLREIVAEVKPDVIVEDNVVAFPALQTSDATFIRLVSCNPLEIRGEHVAPTFSGLPADDTEDWEKFRDEYGRTHRVMWEEFNEWVQAQGARPLPDLEFLHASEDMNLYLYPEELDYVAERPLDATWHRLDSSVRQTDENVELPEDFVNRPEGSALIYLSLGSLGSADVDLMKRLIGVLSKTPHKIIVSKGPQAHKFELAENMWGAEFLPQTKIIPQVDLVINHGGNNTVTESMHYGKPMILLPLFWDQYDNAQRVHERNFGLRLSTYGFTDAELVGAIDDLLQDEDLAQRLAAASERIQAANGLVRAADLIEQAGLERA